MDYVMLSRICPVERREGGEDYAARREHDVKVRK